VERRRDFAHLAQIGGLVFIQTRLPQRPVEPFDHGMLIGSPGRTDGRFHPQAVPEAYERAGEVAPAGGPDQARVTVKARHLRQPILPQCLHDRCTHGLRRVVLAGLDAESDGGANIDEVERLSHVLLLAVGIRWHPVRVLEVELPAFQRTGAVHRHMEAEWTVADPPMLGEELPDGAGRAGQAQPLSKQVLLAVEVGQDGLWARRALYVVRRLAANL
jgi:hypothetical protein